MKAALEWGIFAKSVVVELTDMTEKSFNPFDSDKDKQFFNLTIAKFSGYFAEKAEEMKQSLSPESRLFQKENAREWAMDEIEDILDKDDWSRDDATKLAAICFLLAASPDE